MTDKEDKAERLHITDQIRKHPVAVTAGGLAVGAGASWLSYVLWRRRPTTELQALEIFHDPEAKFHSESIRIMGVLLTSRCLPFAELGIATNLEDKPLEGVIKTLKEESLDRFALVQTVVAGACVKVPGLAERSHYEPTEFAQAAFGAGKFGPLLEAYLDSPADTQR